MTTDLRDPWIRRSKLALMLTSLALVVTTLAAPWNTRAAPSPAGAWQPAPSHEGPEPTRASVTLVVDGMMKSRSGAT